MIGKITRGNGFRGCLEYVFAPEDWKGEARDAEPPRLIGGNMLGTTPRQLAAEFAVSRNLADSRVKNPVYHVSLSLAPGESLTDEEWREAATLFIEKMGKLASDRGDKPINAEKNQWCLVRHTAPPGSGKLDHVHLVLSRTDLDGVTSKLRQDRHDIQKVCRELERIFNLSPVEISEETKERQRRRREQRRRGAILLKQGKEIPAELQREWRSASRADLAHWARLTREGKEIPPNLQTRVEVYNSERYRAKTRVNRRRGAKAVEAER